MNITLHLSGIGHRRFCGADAKDAQAAATAACRRAHAWIVAYGCRFCGGHHIGHPPRNVRQAIKARRERNGS